MHRAFVEGDFVVRHTYRGGSAVPVDQALEKAYNKPAKGHAGIVGISRRKEAVSRWNLVKHKKLKYRSFLQEICGLSDYDEYALHHEYTKSIRETDENCVNAIIGFFNERGNPFDTNSLKPVTNVFTNSQIDEESATFLEQCLELGSNAYQKFYSSRLKDKTTKLFDTISKTRKIKRSKSCDNTADLKKETVTFIRYIDYAKSRGYELKDLLKYELTSTSFFLTKNGYLRKPDKADLGSQLKKILENEILANLPSLTGHSMSIIDFMESARKIRTKKLKLKTFSDLSSFLWTGFAEFSKNCTRLDIIFDLYRQRSIKANEEADDRIMFHLAHRHGVISNLYQHAIMQICYYILCE